MRSSLCLAAPVNESCNEHHCLLKMLNLVAALIKAQEKARELQL